MKQIVMTAQKLLETIELFESVELYVWDMWASITHIANHQIINGAWWSDGNLVFIETGDFIHQYPMMDIVTVRYPDNPNIIDVNPSLFPASLDDDDTQPLATIAPHTNGLSLFKAMTEMSEEDTQPLAPICIIEGDTIPKPLDEDKSKYLSDIEW